MTELEPNLSRVDRKKGRKWSDNLLNILIVIVVVLIIIISIIILNGGEENDENKAVDKEQPLTEETDAGQTTDIEKDEDIKEDAEGKEDSAEVESEEPGIVTYESSDEQFVAKTVIDPAWEPVATTQTGEHVSLYDGKSVDWEEKQQALAYATGLTKDSMIFWKIKNGGSPQNAIGIVSSSDRKEMYRVYLEWEEEKGWKPVKMDVLTSLDFDY